MAMIDAQATRFDRDWRLQDLHAVLDSASLLAGLAALLGENVCLIDERGEAVLGRRGEGRNRVPVHGELEPVGWLEADAPEARLRAVAALLEAMLKSAARYRMAAELHLEAVREDYRALQEKHAALQESEARYRTLAEELERRVAEQVETIQQAQRQLYQAEKMAAVGQLAAGLAHEINNPIGFIKSNLNTALTYLSGLQAFAERMAAGGSGEDLRRIWREQDLDAVLADFLELVQECLDGAERIARIVADLKGFSRVDGVGEETADVNEIIHGVCNVAAGQVRDRADLVLDLEPLPPLRCRPGPLGQVFLNLLLNAAQAMDGRGEIRFHTESSEGEIVVRVTDQGCGIPDDVLPRIFDPFFTTKPVGEGTGLGLTVCSDIVRAHGGRIEVDSKEGVGTTVSVYLPVR